MMDITKKLPGQKKKDGVNGDDMNSDKNNGDNQNYDNVNGNKGNQPAYTISQKQCYK